MHTGNGNNKGLQLCIGLSFVECHEMTTACNTASLGPRLAVKKVSLSFLQVLRKDGQLVLSELTHRDGLLAGSSFMDDMFVGFVKELLGHEGFEHRMQQHPQDFSKLKCKAWEEAKLAFTGKTAAIIDPPLSLIRACLTRSAS